MERMAHKSPGVKNRMLAVIGLAAAVAIAGCGGGEGGGGGDGGAGSAGGASGSEETTPPTIVLPGDGFVPSVGTGTDDYPVTSFSLPLMVTGFVVAAEHQQHYAMEAANDLRSCTIGMGALASFEPPGDLAEIEALIAARSTVAGGFATTADLSAGDNFSFWRLGDVGTENWSSFFHGTDERWSGSGQQAVVEAKFFPWYWVDDDGTQRGFPVLGVRVRWSGETTENLTSRTGSAMVEFECYFAPTGDQLFAHDALRDPNDNEILDDDEVETLRERALLQSHLWLKW